MTDTQSTPETAKSTPEKKIRKCGYYDNNAFRIGKVPETDLLPEVNFTFRPMTHIRVVELNTILSKTNDYKLISKKVDELIPETLIDWDLEKADGSRVDFKNAEEMTLVDDYIIEQVTEIIRQEPKELETKLKN